MKQQKNPDVKSAAALLGGSAAILFIGIFQFLTEAYASVKPYFTLHAGIGPLSGKIAFAYLIGLIVFFGAQKMLHTKKKIHLMNYFCLLVVAVIIASLLSLTPVTSFLLGTAE